MYPDVYDFLDMTHLCFINNTNKAIQQFLVAREMNLIVGTFNTPSLHTLHFDPPTRTKDASLRILAKHNAIGSHSWLALSPSKQFLYCTAWTEPPSVVAYRINQSTTDQSPGLKSAAPQLEHINSAPIASRSGYVAVHPSGKFLYSVGGPSGEVFTLRDDGGIGECIQVLSFIEQEASTSQGLLHGDFGGLRHGAHSVDLSADGKALYVADIGRNCVWTYSVNIASDRKNNASSAHLLLGEKHIAPRHNDGPRHTTPHPNGQMLYSLQEHSSMVDAFEVAEDGVTLKHCSGAKIIPADKAPEDYWADEVRLSNKWREGGQPKYLYASTRGLKDNTKGYVAVIELDASGQLGETLHIWETPTSGGWANAIEPAPASAYKDGLDNETQKEWLALTDSLEGFVFVLSFDGQLIEEVARVCLGEGQDEVVGAATAVWL